MSSSGAAKKLDNLVCLRVVGEVINGATVGLATCARLQHNRANTYFFALGFVLPLMARHCHQVTVSRPTTTANLELLEQYIN